MMPRTKNPFFLFFILMNALFLGTGLAFLWHYIGPNPVLGMVPEGEMVTDEDWYRYNELTGWALLFCGTVSTMLTWQLRNMPSRKKYALSVLAGLGMSTVLAALALEFVSSYLNIN